MTDLKKDGKMQCLLLGLKGEKDMMANVPCLTMLDVDTGETRWCLAGMEHSMNPFGKLVSKPARVLPNGRIFEHKRHYHGWFASLVCTKEFYESHKEQLLPYDVTDEKHFKTDHLPQWL